jgi:DNA-binding transcriptional MerR regulator
VYSIGDLSQLGGVTPRTLRHYHDLGVLVPTHVDPETGYRRYDESQLGELLQVLALKGLGFSLGDIKQVIDGGVGPAELRGRLLLRRSELHSEFVEGNARLERVEAQIQRLERRMSDQHPPAVTVAIKRLPAAHLAVTSAVSPSFGPAHIGPVIRPLYPQLREALNVARVAIVGPSVAYYEDAGDDGVMVHAGFPIDASVTRVSGLDVVDLPEVELAATSIHHGDMATVDVDTVMPMFDWMRAHGFHTTGYSRELYLDCPKDITQWRTEMQFAIEADSTS